uniref:Uncharacterized protein n=1 Tax=Mucochytrium quahogii TaxID=96639 RepID=A0A7S2WRE7_9STRA|mmetsp:Transcript_18528/g.30209  ORF Transcript_18528/g.30209 Transcript_18528/m.30209 type:complete len:167 (-) Transcript_18528:143-643(-)
MPCGMIAFVFSTAAVACLFLSLTGDWIVCSENNIAWTLLSYPDSETFELSKILLQSSLGITTATWLLCIALLCKFRFTKIIIFTCLVAMTCLVLCSVLFYLKYDDADTNLKQCTWFDQLGFRLLLAAAGSLLLTLVCTFFSSPQSPEAEEDLVQDSKVQPWDLESK